MENKAFYIEDEFKGKYTEISELFSSGEDSNSLICNPKYLEWQYGSNPHGKAIISCAREESTNKLVGVYIVNPVDLWINSKKIKAALSLNTFTHKEHRGKGMFTSLAKTCYEISEQKNVQCIIGFPNPMSYGGFIKKLGFKEMGSVPYLFKPLNYLNLAKNILLKSKSSSSILDIEFDEAQKVIEITSAQLSTLEPFFEKHREEHRFQTYRSADHYQWRFFENPINTYVVFASMSSNDTIESVIVLRSISGKTHDIQLVDFCCLTEKAGFKIIKHLVKQTKSKFSFARVFAQKGTEEYRVLTALGFVSKDKFSKEKTFLPFIFKGLNKQDIEIPFDEWHLAMADSDVV
jgi:GNAT acetyltransferase-like protein